ncbi:hypothetical protein HOO65_040824 [Ceratocystis lukuohia]|uniref:Uncharacterized protein n=1 Tax=Ceratocystis lukuohia TaxID=2019550 RepID=A0ABR4MJM7_9PEZI
MSDDYSVNFDTQGQATRPRSRRRRLSVASSNSYESLLRQEHNHTRLAYRPRQQGTTAHHSLASPSPLHSPATSSVSFSQAGSDDILAGSESGTILAQAETLPRGVAVSRSMSRRTTRRRRSWAQSEGSDTDDGAPATEGMIEGSRWSQHWSTSTPQAPLPARHSTRGREDVAPGESEYGYNAQRSPAAESMARARRWGGYSSPPESGAGRWVAGYSMPNQTWPVNPPFEYRARNHERSFDIFQRQYDAAGAQFAAPPGAIGWNMGMWSQVNLGLPGNGVEVTLRHGYPGGGGTYSTYSPYTGRIDATSRREHAVWMNSCLWCQICAGPICCRGVVCSRSH